MSPLRRRAQAQAHLVEPGSAQRLRSLVCVNPRHMRPPCLPPSTSCDEKARIMLHGAGGPDARNSLHLIVPGIQRLLCYRTWMSGIDMEHWQGRVQEVLIW